MLFSLNENVQYVDILTYTVRLLDFVLTIVPSPDSYQSLKLLCIRIFFHIQKLTLQNLQVLQIMKLQVLLIYLAAASKVE